MAAAYNTLVNNVYCYMIGFLAIKPDDRMYLSARTNTYG